MGNNDSRHSRAGAMPGNFDIQFSTAKIAESTKDRFLNLELRWFRVNFGLGNWNRISNCTHRVLLELHNLSEW